MLVLGVLLVHKQHRDSTVISIQNSKISNVCSMVVSNSSIHRDLKIPTVKEEIMHFHRNHLSKLEYHPNLLAIYTLDNSEDIYILKRHKFFYHLYIHLPFGFNE